MPLHALPLPALPLPALPLHALPLHALPLHALPSIQLRPAHFSGIAIPTRCESSGMK